MFGVAYDDYEKWWLTGSESLKPPCTWWYKRAFLRVMRVCGYIQLVTPREVAIAVRMLIAIWITIFQVSLFIDFYFLKIYVVAAALFTAGIAAAGSLVTSGSAATALGSAAGGSVTIATSVRSNRHVEIHVGLALPDCLNHGSLSTSASHEVEFCILEQVLDMLRLCSAIWLSVSLLREHCRDCRGG